MMYPTVFATPKTLSGPMFQTVFFGFCALSILLIAYLVDRHVLISKLRARIVARERAIRLIQEEASKDFLASLPAIDTFMDRLCMEFRRASGVNQPLSLFAVEINVLPEICKPSETVVVHADAGRAILRKTRGEDSIFLLDPGVFALLLPRISAGIAELMKQRFEEELRHAAGLVPRFHFRIRLINYPDDVKSAHEIMEAIYPLLATHPIQPLPWEEAVPAAASQRMPLAARAANHTETA
jgi:GGDEF domain-containing protein